MKLVIIPNVDGDSFAIIDEKYPPENYIDVIAADLRACYTYDDLVRMLITKLHEANMKLVIIPDVDGDSFAIIDERYPPENYIDITAVDLTMRYNYDDLVCMLTSFNS